MKREAHGQPSVRVEPAVAVAAPLDDTFTQRARTCGLAWTAGALVAACLE
jgi:hypothetical protein